MRVVTVAHFDGGQNFRHGKRAERITVEMSKFSQIAQLLLLLMVGAAMAQPLIPVHFEVNQTTVLGQSVYVLGDLPELGGGDVTQALKLSPVGTYPIWSADIQLPPGTVVNYQYYIRLDSASQVGNPANGTAVGNPLSLTTPGEPLPTRSGWLRYFSGDTAPTLEILEEGGGHRSVPFVREGDGRSPAESLWRADFSGLPPMSDWQFRIALAGGGTDTPSYGDHYITSLTGAWLQDGHLYNYQPAPSISPSQVIRREDFGGSLDSGGTRRLYIYTPRGYAEHTDKSYPVLYMHDGQNCFQTFADDAFLLSWRAEEVADLLIQQGRMRECIIIGVANGEGNRSNEYLPDYPVDAPLGASNLTALYYRDEVKPFINSQYRTLTDRNDTAVTGSSLGGLFSAYLAWEFPEFAHHHAGLSSSFWISQETIDRFQSGQPRDVRLWIDSGSAGASGDRMKKSYDARDALLANSYVLGEDFWHMVDIGAGHNETSWNGRLDQVFLFLFPISQDQVFLEGFLMR